MVLLHKVEAEHTNGSIMSTYRMHYNALSLVESIFNEFVALRNYLILRIKDDLKLLRTN